ncbi:hypothetical protein SODALDRAFT_347875 [Sodiomyces alkalinus F11]|uniref:Uncharacterized protein n=1 Tax=Sodiomyces alkalinus (strain CBS 110278 / VKM F-3762 / F11) TaxID=1314773 RepID=A0A3N2Q8T6_SODAK|nr:hypothetical protein SODALDRAFT_347875 [Sodiomyces alkalinus F11]ROT43058.1 hypothetical protein SODALDRAFT_347875 [Sodiomyces alkalinus F11]
MCPVRKSTFSQVSTDDASDDDGLIGQTTCTSTSGPSLPQLQPQGSGHPHLSLTVPASAPCIFNTSGYGPYNFSLTVPATCLSPDSPGPDPGPGPRFDSLHPQLKRARPHAQITHNFDINGTASHNFSLTAPVAGIFHLIAPTPAPVSAPFTFNSTGRGS